MKYRLFSVVVVLCAATNSAIGDNVVSVTSVTANPSGANKVLSVTVEPSRGNDGLSVTAPRTGEDAVAPETVERITWNKRPIPITLPVGEERLIHFPGSVRIGVPSEIQPILRTQSVDGTVYWLAGQPFDVSRVQVQDVESGQIFMIDLDAVENDPSARSTPIEIVTAGIEKRQPVVAEEEVKTPEPDYVTLTRFAAQQLYAPVRLLTTPPGIYRASVSSEPVGLLRGFAIEATPIAAWRGGSLHVTAVKLRNLGRDPVILDPRVLRGTWRTITFQHARLHPAGSETDTTAVYLISTRPFAECL